MPTLLPWLFTAVVSVNARLYPTTAIPDVDALAIASAIDAVGPHSPWALSPREGGFERLAAELVVLAGTEGHFKAAARGHDAYGESLGLWQIHETTLNYVGATRDDALDLRKAAVIAARLVKMSHEVCARRAPEERLGWYSSGGRRCNVPEGLSASRHRERLVEILLRRHPPYWTEPCPEGRASRYRPSTMVSDSRFAAVLVRRRKRTARSTPTCLLHD